VVEHGCAWLLANQRLDRHQDRQGRIILALLHAACRFVIANRLSTFGKRCLSPSVCDCGEAWIGWCATDESCDEL
jgi:hypothetical protein